MRRVKRILPGLLLCWISLAVSAQKSFYTCHEVTADEFHAWQQAYANFLVIDIRGKEDYEMGHIPRAMWLSGDSALLSVCDTLDADQPILIYDQSDFESIDACLLMASRGKRQVFHLKSGYDMWKTLGYFAEYSKKQNR